MKRLLSLLLLFAMLAGVLPAAVACKGPANPGGGGGGGEESDVEYLDKLDSYGHSLDFSAQEEFVVCHLEEYYYEVYGEENSTEKIDTLIANRNRLLESRFGLEIATHSGVNNTGGTVQHDYVQLCLNSGDVPFDAAAMISGQAGNLIFGNGGNLLDFRAEIPYVKDSVVAGEEWWPKEVNAASTVMGRQFVAVSDFSITAVEMTYAVIFNKDLAKTTNVVVGIDPDKYDLESTLYDVVRNNDWVFDTMSSIVKDYWRDNPTTGKRGEHDAEDRFGMVGPMYTDVDVFAYAFGFNFVENNGVDEPTLWEWSDAQYDAIVALRDLYYSGGVFSDDTVRYLADRAAFFAQEDRALFQLSPLMSLKFDVIHNMEQNFGVLPYPKWNREQARFYTGSADNYTVLLVPYTALWDEERLRMTGALIEALSAENCKSVKQPYYDEIITHHNVTDGDSAEMINILMEGRTYDLSMYHYSTLYLDSSALAIFFEYLVKNEHVDIVQYWQSNSGSLDLQIADLLNRYASIGN